MEKILNITNIIREMQIKTTIRYHLTPVKMTYPKDNTISKRYLGQVQLLMPVIPAL